MKERIGKTYIVQVMFESEKEEIAFEKTLTEIAYYTNNNLIWNKFLGLKGTAMSGIDLISQQHNEKKFNVGGLHLGLDLKK